MVEVESATEKNKNKKTNIALNLISVEENKSLCMVKLWQAILFYSLSLDKFCCLQVIVFSQVKNLRLSPGNIHALQK